MAQPNKRRRGWHSGFAPPRRAWERLRRRKLDAVGWRCERCGRAGKLEVHHRVSLKDGGAALPELTGLEVLCRECHWDEHGQRRRKPLTDKERRERELINELL